MNISHFKALVDKLDGMDVVALAISQQALAIECELTRMRVARAAGGASGGTPLPLSFLLDSSDDFGRGRPVQLVFKSSASGAPPYLIQASGATHFGAITTVPATASSVMQSEECKMQNGEKPKANPNAGVVQAFPNGRWG